MRPGPSAPEPNSVWLRSMIARRSRVKFYLTAAEAEAASFRGAGEGAEQIGSALLFVDPAVDPKTEDVLKVAEGCLAEL